MYPLLSRIEKLNTLYTATIIFIFTVFCYFNTLGNSLFYDDEHFIYNNVYVQHFSVLDFFTHSTTSGGGGGVSNYYRPLLSLLFSLQYQILGNSGFIFHLFSLLLHTSCGILIFIILKKLFKQAAPALLASLVFVIHPVQTEAVSYASGQGDPLSLFFLLGSIFFVLKQKNKTALCLFIASLLSKETALLAPGFITLIFLTQEHVISFNTIKKSVIRSIPFWAVSFFYFFLRLTILNFSDTLNFYNGANVYTNSIFVRLNTFFHIVPSYAVLLVKPFPLFIDHNVPVYVAVDAITVLVTLLFALAAIASVYFFKKIPVLFFSFWWVVLGFIPTSGIIPINGIMYEHFLYYPSIGMFTGIGFGSYFLVRQKPWLSIPTFLLVILTICYLAIVTIQRNSEWHDPITFYNQTLRYTESARIRNNLAMSYADAGNTTKSIEEYKKAIQVSDTYPQTHYNLGNSYITAGDYVSAEHEYLASIKLDPTFDRPYVALVNLYKQTGQKQKLVTFLKSVEILAEKNNSYMPLLNYLKSLVQ